MMSVEYQHTPQLAYYPMTTLTWQTCILAGNLVALPELNQSCRTITGCPNPSNGITLKRELGKLEPLRFNNKNNQK